MSAAKCQFPFSYRRKSEEAMTAVIWLGCSRCFPLCQWNSSPSSSNEIANSQVAVLVLCIGFIGFDKLSSVCKIYLSNQAAEGAILLHSPDPTSVMAHISPFLRFHIFPSSGVHICPNILESGSHISSNIFRFCLQGTNKIRLRVPHCHSILLFLTVARGNFSPNLMTGYDFETLLDGITDMPIF